MTSSCFFECNTKIISKAFQINSATKINATLHYTSFLFSSSPYYSPWCPVVWQIVQPHWKTFCTDQMGKTNCPWVLKGGITFSSLKLYVNQGISFKYSSWSLLNKVSQSIPLLSEFLCFQSNRVSWCAPLSASHRIELSSHYQTDSVWSWGPFRPCSPVLDGVGHTLQLSMDSHFLFFCQLKFSLMSNLTPTKYYETTSRNMVAALHGKFSFLFLHLSPAYVFLQRILIFIGWLNFLFFSHR